MRHDEAVVLPDKLWTREECQTLESAGVDLQPYELIEGELVAKVVKNGPHMVAALVLAEYLRTVFGGWRVFAEPTADVSPIDNPTSRPEPDIAVLRRSFLEIRSAIPPHEVQLIAEISDSSLAHDLGVKARLYARAGIPEYWVVDLKAKRVLVHRNSERGEYQEITSYFENDFLSPLSAPQPSLAVASLF